MLPASPSRSAASHAFSWSDMPTGGGRGSLRFWRLPGRSALGAAHAQRHIERARLTLTTKDIAMNDDDRAAIIDLFQRLREAEGRAGPRDPEAETLIRSAIAAQPGAP